MAFTSYAQNFEDVLLHRALKGITHGRYIDVGAADPEFHSVTKAFYDLGWSGINLEPVEKLYERLVDQRPRDISLNLALGKSKRSVKLYSVTEFDEISTTVSSLGKRYAAEGRGVVETFVQGSTLKAVWAAHVTGEVHFLKIDVEGAENDVLRGADFVRQRPWIVVVEVVSFGPLSDSVAETDGIMSAADYSNVYFDGLNRYYVANERVKTIGPAFETPVNVTDDFVIPSESTAALALREVASAFGIEGPSQPREILQRSMVLVADRVRFENETVALAAELAEHGARSRERLTELESGIEAQAQAVFERERYIAVLAAEVANLRSRIAAEQTSSRQQLEAVFQSSSWRVTLPLRVARHPARYLRALRHR